MTMRAALLCACALSLAACGEPVADQGNSIAAAAAGKPDAEFAKRIASLTPQQLNGLLFRAVRDAGRDCQQVTSSQKQADVGGRPAWTAVCDERTTWLVVLGAEGVATVTAAGTTPAAG
ncbi:hypothetical protein GGQ80_000343 [Sphingomonas jinjuensis]|uniref:Lipoprotein n=1 Tax=Sphingomonas jinjuensis TaxID=535907 RepID=A0A840FAC9_9SPHN|nr:hypothetical protein [Sphingomonas jinjuensis]MBB4152467.1 hypothetical protein [Sphingomonas jinjuensis]